MVVGVNGVGKTTTIGKLAYHFKRAGKKVLLGASDTFRAAAVDQLVQVEPSERSRGQVPLRIGVACAQAEHLFLGQTVDDRDDRNRGARR